MKKTTYVCDYCREEFGKTPGVMERFTLLGNRYTDAAGSTDQSRPVLEMHESCWRKFAKECSER